MPKDTPFIGPEQQFLELFFFSFSYKFLSIFVAHEQLIVYLYNVIKKEKYENENNGL